MDTACILHTFGACCDASRHVGPCPRSCGCIGTYRHQARTSEGSCSCSSQEGCPCASSCPSICMGQEDGCERRCSPRTGQTSTYRCFGCHQGCCCTPGQGSGGRPSTSRETCPSSCSSSYRHVTSSRTCCRSTNCRGSRCRCVQGSGLGLGFQGRPVVCCTCCTSSDACSTRQTSSFDQGRERFQGRQEGRKRRRKGRQRKCQGRRQEQRRRQG